MKTQQCGVSALKRQIFSLRNAAKTFFFLLFSLILLINYSVGVPNLNSKSATSNIKSSGQSSQLLNLSTDSVSSKFIFGNSTLSNLSWNKQDEFGNYTYANGVSSDYLGNSYITGSTTIGISGNTQTGNEDYFLAQYDVSGNLQWTRQVGSPLGTTVAKGISTDSNGNIYITGYTNSGISGQSQTGTTDYFIVKYNSLGNLIWSKQVGVPNGNTYATGIKTNITGGNIYVSGYTDKGISGETQSGQYDYFIAKYDSMGNLLWTRQVGTTGGTTEANGISTDIHGYIYVAGFTNTGISGQTQTGQNDYFIAQYDVSGNLKWTKQVGASGGNTAAYAVAADTYDGVSIYVAGGTSQGISGQVQTGNEDYFIACYDILGNQIWTKQVGAPNGTTQANGVSADSNGNVYVAGNTNRAISGQFWAGGTDYFVAMYDKSAGNLQWTSEVGSYGGYTKANGVSNDDNGNIFLAGYTTTGISGQTQTGMADYFIADHKTSGDLEWSKQVGGVITAIWSKQVGAYYGDVEGTGISADESGNIYVTGNTAGGISGQKQNGNKDYFISKYDVTGKLVWSRQVGASNGYTYGLGISADTSGDIYVTGYTDKGISGQVQNGGYDYFIAKYNADGNLIWTRQVGSAPNGSAVGYGISVNNSGYVYVTGYTSQGLSGQKQNGFKDYFIAKYNAAGNLVWSRQVGTGTGSTYGQGVSADNAGHIYVTGYTDKGISGQKQNGSYYDYFIAKYDASGNLAWSRQVGGQDPFGERGITYGYGVSTDNSGNIYVAGTTNSGLSGQEQNGWENYFIAKYDASGNLTWSRQVGVASAYGYTYGEGVSADNSGNIYVTGYTKVGISGQKQHGNYDYFIAKYDVTGNLRWSSQVGASGGTTAGYGISTDGSGNTYVTGRTNVGINGQKQDGGGYDYFITKYTN